MIKKDKIIRVDKFINKVNVNYGYKKELKIFGITIREAGIYVLPIVASPYLKDPDPEFNIIVDNIVYFKPHVRIDVGQNYIYEYFNTEKELDIWMEDLRSSSEWI